MDDRELIQAYISWTAVTMVAARTNGTPPGTPQPLIRKYFHRIRAVRSPGNSTTFLLKIHRLRLGAEEFGGGVLGTQALVD
jgi:hypothetical protein